MKEISPETPETHWSSDELKSMLNQALALEFIRLKNEEAEKANKKGWWPGFFYSSIFSTILTVFGGTIGGTFIANSVQEKSKALEERQQIVEEAFTNVGKTIAASQEIIDISSNSWDENRGKLKKTARQDIIEQKRAYWKAYNAAIANWRVQRERIGLILVSKGVVPQQKTQAIDAWAATVKAVEDFSECAVLYNSESAAQPELDSKVQNACSSTRKEVRKQLNALATLTTNSDSRGVPFYKRLFGFQ
jgi:hypothetical protein